MLERARAAGGDDRNRHRSGHGPRELEIVAVLGAVTIHARQENLAGAEPGGLASPFDGVATGRPTTAVGIDLPCSRGSRQPGLLRRWPVRGAGWLQSRGIAWLRLSRVDGHHDALAAEPFSGLRDQLRSEEHTSELQSLAYLVCRLLLEKKK